MFKPFLDTKKESVEWLKSLKKVCANVPDIHTYACFVIDNVRSHIIACMSTVSTILLMIQALIILHNKTDPKAS